jgi:hypothetical protein
VKRLVVVAFLVAAVAATGCSVREQGRPTAVGPRNVNESVPSSAAPPITSPALDVEAYVDRVCDLLTVSQLASFGVSRPGRLRPDPIGVACAWHPPLDGGGSVDVTIFSELNYDWDGVYERKARWQFFEDAGEINGYPAVHLGDEDERPLGKCRTMVATDSDQLFEVIVFMNVPGSPEFEDPCAQSDLVAGFVIDTLEGAR